MQNNNLYQNSINDFCNGSQNGISSGEYLTTQHFCKVVHKYLTLLTSCVITTAGLLFISIPLFPSHCNDTFGNCCTYHCTLIFIFVLLFQGSISELCCSLHSWRSRTNSFIGWDITMYYYPLHLAKSSTNSKFILLSLNLSMLC